MRTPIADEIQKVLFDVDYPAMKDDLVGAAERHGAAEDAVRALRAMPPVEYRSEAEVLRSIDVDPSERGAATAGDVGAGRREHTHRGLAEHLKETERPEVEDEVGSNEGS